jgi:hypothetical protein
MNTTFAGCGLPRKAGLSVSRRTCGRSRRTRKPSAASPSSSIAAGTRHKRESCASLDQMPATAITAVSITSR